MRKGVIYTSRLLKPIFQAIWKQLTSSTGFVFTKHALKKCKEYGLSEENIRDVFYHGSEVKLGMRVRKYTGFAGYTIGLIYAYDKALKCYLILSCWKRRN